MELNGKNVLITGASGGIGKAIADTFIKHGCKVILHYNSNPIQSDYFTVKADISKKEEIKLMFNKIEEKYGHLDILINTVGIEETYEDQLDTNNWQKTFQVNLFGTVECVKYTLNMMQKGLIVNITSIMGNQGIVGLESLAYSISKAALQKFSENLSLMLAPNIRVVSISPGYTITPIWDMFSKEQKAEAIKSVPIKRFIKPEEVAKFITSVAENDAITGTNFTIAGGFNLKNII